MFFLYSRIAFIGLVISSINCAGITHGPVMMKADFQAGRQCVEYQLTKCHNREGNTFACYMCRTGDVENEPR